MLFAVTAANSIHLEQSLCRQAEARECTAEQWIGSQFEVEYGHCRIGAEVRRTWN